MKDCFKLTRKSQFFSSPRFFPIEDLTKALKKMKPGTFVYFDLSRVGEADTEKYLRALSKKESIFYGILDPADKIDDVAGLFHSGALDYLGKNTLKQGVTAKRLNQVFRFIEATRGEELAASKKPVPEGNWIPAGDDWNTIASGKEYTFFFLFVELDDKDELEQRYERENLTVSLASFRKYIEASVSRFNGRIWMWSRFGGLILFPVGTSLGMPLKAGFRLMLFKHLYDIEGSKFPHFLSVRLALHIGNTVYSKQNTGHIVSDSLNSVFHLGQQYVKPGNFNVTETVLKFADPPLKRYFLEAGSFERRKIYRMRQSIHHRTIV